MRKVIGSYLFLVLYVVAIFRPVFPVMEYIVNYDYIVEQLCENKDKPILACNGKCYLAKEIKKTVPINPIDDPSRTPRIEFDKIPVTTLFKNKYTILTLNLSRKLMFIYSKNEKVNNHIEFVFRPPKNLA